MSVQPKSEIMIERSRRELWYYTTITVPYAKTTKYCSANIVLQYRSNRTYVQLPEVTGALVLRSERVNRQPVRMM